MAPDPQRGRVGRPQPEPRSPSQPMATMTAGPAPANLACHGARQRPFRNLNAKIDFKNEDDKWKHHFYAKALSARQARGTPAILTAAAPPKSASSSTPTASSSVRRGALKMNEVSYWVAALRYGKRMTSRRTREPDTFSLGYGHSFIRTNAPGAQRRSGSRLPPRKAGQLPATRSRSHRPRRCRLQAQPDRYHRPGEQQLPG